MPGAFLADAIRSHIGPASAYSEEALLAVVDKCEAMRSESSRTSGGVGWAIANEIEYTIVRALNVGIPLEHVAEFQRLFRP